MAVLFRIAVCLFAFSTSLYSIIDQQNCIMSTRMRLPHLYRELRQIEEENAILQYEIKKFEDPCSLMRLAQKPQFAHLKFPLQREVRKMEPGLALTAERLEMAPYILPSRLPLVVGAVE